MTAALQDLVREARAAADPSPIWLNEGGRACPIGWEDCSQPVFRLAGTDHYDYGERGGLGWKHCHSGACPHGGVPPEPWLEPCARPAPGTL